jgi:transcription initiation factor TFIID subunit 1
MEYIEEAPPILLNYGMASTIINYYRMSEKPRDNDDNVTQTKYRNMEKTLAKNRLIGSLNISQNSIGLGGSSYRIPRHVQLLLQQRNQRQLYDTDDTHIPKLPYGETKVLTQDNESPFLGEIAEDEIIQSMMNNLFRSPIVQHKPNPTDFLLIHTKILAKSVLYSIREIPAIFISGQTEPQKIVPRPIRNGLSRVQERMLMLGIARYLLTMPNGANLTEIQDHILKFYRRKRFLYGPGGIKKLLKDRIADEIITNSGKKWISKELVSHDGHGNHPSYHRTVDYDDYEEDTKNIEKQYTVEELIKSFTPEDVCLQESCNAAELRLLSYGIIDIELQRVRQWLERMKRLKDCRIDNAAKLKMIVNDKMMQLNSISSRPNNDQLNTLVMKLNKVLRILLNDIKKLDEKIKLGQFVYGRLLIAPWNTTEAYVKSHIEKDGLGKMELSGQGDPSGRGEGFAFVRLLKIDSGQKKSTDKLVHTDKDLRKLTRPDLHRLLKGFGMTEAELKTLKRW